MACGCVLVSTRNGGSDEYAMDGVTTLTCEPGDSAALARPLVKLLNDDKLRQRIAAAGRRQIALFDWDTSAARLEAFLDDYAAAPERHGFGGWPALRDAPLWGRSR